MRMNEVEEIMRQYIQEFMDHYLPKEEIVHRLPVSVPIESFWEQLTRARMDRRMLLPLLDQSDQLLYLVVNRSITQQSDQVAAFARRELEEDLSSMERDLTSVMLEEALASAEVEGINIPKDRARRLVRYRQTPVTQAEETVVNIYQAIVYMLEHLHEPLTLAVIEEMARLLTIRRGQNTLTGYRRENVSVVRGRQVIYNPPDTYKIPSMMLSLEDFIRESPIHPVLKACVAHYYLLYIYPYAEGNGRLARLVGAMMLMQGGYGFFRHAALSRQVAMNQDAYEKAMTYVENSGGDVTYFVDVTSRMLSASLKTMEHHLTHEVWGRKTLDAIEVSRLPKRLKKGCAWLLNNQKASVTVEEWKKKHRVSTESARHDLLFLRDMGLVDRTMEGRKAVFTIQWGKKLSPETWTVGEKSEET